MTNQDHVEKLSWFTMEFPELPKDWQKEITGKNPDIASFDLSTHRTQMSEHRTFLSDARSHMSNERTHLSYFRTSLSLMSFGITLNRFSIYLRENKVTNTDHAILYQTEFVGLGMVLLGIAILVWALYRFRRVTREIETNSYTTPTMAMTIITLAIIFLGGISAIWLFVERA